MVVSWRQKILGHLLALICFSYLILNAFFGLQYDNAFTKKESALNLQGFQWWVFKEFLNTALHVHAHFCLSVYHQHFFSFESRVHAITTLCAQ